MVPRDELAPSLVGMTGALEVDESEGYSAVPLI